MNIIHSMFMQYIYIYIILQKKVFAFVLAVLYFPLLELGNELHCLRKKSGNILRKWKGKWNKYLETLCKRESERMCGWKWKRVWLCAFMSWAQNKQKREWKGFKNLARKKKGKLWIYRKTLDYGKDPPTIYSKCASILFSGYAT